MLEVILVSVPTASQSSVLTSIEEQPIAVAQGEIFLILSLGFGVFFSNCLEAVTISSHFLRQFQCCDKESFRLQA